MSPRRTNCVYCDTNPAETRDHVVPKSLFTPPYPPNLVTVPACRPCNEAKGVDDDFLRDYLTTDFAGISSPSAEHVFENKVRHSVSRNSSELAREFLRSAQVKPFYTKGGIYLGDFVEAPVHESRLPRVLGRIIRGLFFYYTKQIIPLSYPVQVSRIMPWDMEEVWNGFRKLTFSACRPLGDVFGGGCARVKEDPLSTMWLLTFYERVHFSVICFNPDLPRLVSSQAS